MDGEWTTFGAANYDWDTFEDQDKTWDKQDRDKLLPIVDALPVINTDWATQDDEQKTLENEEEDAEGERHYTHMQPPPRETISRDEDYAWYISEWAADFQADLDARGGLREIILRPRRRRRPTHRALH